MRALKNVTVAILAGGSGTRLTPVLQGSPKALANVRKHPFLEYLLHQLHNAQFKNVVLCTGYLGELVKKTFGKSYKNLHLQYSQERTPLGTAGGLRYALPHFRSESILAMNGDSYCDVDFSKFWQFHIMKKSKVSIALSRVTDISHYGEVKLGIGNTISGFQEKRAEIRAGYVNAGIYLINVDLIEEIPQGIQISIEKDIFPTWIGRGFYGFKTSKNFIDIGTPERYKRAKQFFAQYNL